MGSFTSLQKRSCNSNGWGSWVPVGSSAGIDYVAESGFCVVYGALMSLGSGESLNSVIVSTNYVAPRTSGNPTVANCYLYTFDPTGSASPPSGYVASDSVSFDANASGTYISFSFSGLDISSSPIYFWFTSSVQYTSYGSNQIYHYSTGNGNTFAPTVYGTFSGSSGEEPGGGESGGSGSGEGSTDTTMYTISVQAGDSGILSVSGGGEYRNSTYVTISAELQSDYDFDGWYVNDILEWSSAESTFWVNAVTGDKTYVAKSKQSIASITILGGTGIALSTRSYRCKIGDMFSAEAEINNGYKFDGWYVDGELVSTDNPYYFYPKSNITLEPKASIYTPETYKITVRKGVLISDINGSYSNPFELYVTEGEQVNLQASYGANCTFKGWYENDAQIGQYQTLPTFIASKDRTLFAIALGNAEYSLTLNKGVGVKSVSGGGVKQQGDICAIYATIEPGYVFDGWYSGSTKVSSYTKHYVDIATSAITLEARATPIEYTVTAVPGTGVTQVSGSGQLGYGTECTLTATLSNGFAFKGWYSENELASSSNPYTFTVTGDITLKAIAETNGSQTFSVQVNPGAGVKTVSGSGIYEALTSCTIKAEPQDGYLFSGWYSNGSLVSDLNPYSFTVTGDISLEAIANSENEEGIWTLVSDTSGEAWDTSGGHSGKSYVIPPYTVLCLTREYGGELQIFGDNDFTVYVTSDSNFDSIDGAPSNIFREEYTSITGKTYSPFDRFCHVDLIFSPDMGPDYPHRIWIKPALPKGDFTGQTRFSTISVAPSYTHYILREEMESTAGEKDGAFPCTIPLSGNLSYPEYAKFKVTFPEAGMSRFKFFASKQSEEDNVGAPAYAYLSTSDNPVNLDYGFPCWYTGFTHISAGEVGVLEREVDAGETLYYYVFTVPGASIGIDTDTSVSCGYASEISLDMEEDVIGNTRNKKRHTPMIYSNGAWRGVTPYIYENDQWVAMKSIIYT